MTAHIWRSGSASESASSEVLAGDGVTGDSIGITDTQFTTTNDTSRGATRFITETLITAVAQRVAELSTVPERHPGPSAETRGLPEDTQNLAARAACVRAPSAVTTTVERKGPIRHAEAAASVAERVAAEVTAGVIADRDLVMTHKS